MTENLIIISLIGFVLGFMLSIPVGGPTSIMIITNALKGRIRFSHQINFGAAFADLFYVFISVYGITSLYSLYKPYIPYVLLLGSVFVIYMGFKISKSKHELEDIDQVGGLETKETVKQKNGIWTGIMLGFLNPGLIISWMSSTVIVFSMLTSFGFNTGGLDQKLNRQLKEIQQINKAKDTTSIEWSAIIQDSNNYHSKILSNNKPLPANYPLVLSVFYSVFISLGSVSWFYLCILFIVKYRDRIKPESIHRCVQVLGWVLIGIGFLLAYQGISMFL